MVEWQYNGDAPLIEIVYWCEITLAPKEWYYNGWETIVFDSDAAWTMFRLRWI
jgi:hypothetical protein